MSLFLKVQLVVSLCIGLVPWNSPSDFSNREVKIFQYSCADGPDVSVSGEILSISTQNSEITGIKEVGDQITISFHCLSSKLEGGITIVAVEDVSF